MIRNHFIKVKIELELDVRQINLLQRIIGGVIPDGKDKEDVIIYVYNKLTNEINKFNESVQ